MKKFEKWENVKGGVGVVSVEHILETPEFNGMGRLFAKFTIPVGASFGYHVHEGDSETYYILSGTGKYTAVKGDEKVESIIGPGDVVFTPDGQGHSLENTGNEDIVLIALVLYSEQHKD